MFNFNNNRKLLFIFLLFFDFRFAFLFKLFYMNTNLFKIKKDHIKINYKRLFSEKNTFNFGYNIFQDLFKCFIFDIENCIDILILSIKDTTNLKSKLIIFVKIEVISS